MKIGIIGAGRQGRRRAKAVQEHGEEVVVVADVNKAAAVRLAEEFRCEATTNWKEGVARQDIEAVIVCTPNSLHAPVCIAAMNNKKHVLCEKPLARNPEEAKAMVDAARKNNVRLKCGFNLRHHPGIRQAREWVDRNAIGEPMFLRCRYGIGGRPGYDKEWRGDPEISGGGQLMDQGMHTLDLSRWFLGEFSEATGFTSTSFWDMPVEDNAFVLLRTQKGQVASLHASWTQWKNLFSFELFGKDGYIIVEGLGGSYGVEKAILGRRDFEKPFAEEVIEYRGEDISWLEEWEELVNAIKEKREPLGNGYDGFKAVELAYMVYNIKNEKNFNHSYRLI